MILNLYGVRDTKMNDYLEVIALKRESVPNYLKTVVNDVKSPFFRQEVYYHLIYLGTFDTETGIIKNDDGSDYHAYRFEDYVDESIRNLQIITQTLNYLPNGYFKMPKEQQEHIQELIVSYAKEYVEKYLSKEQIELVKDKLSQEGEG